MHDIGYIIMDEWARPRMSLTQLVMMNHNPKTGARCMFSVEDLISLALDNKK